MKPIADTKSISEMADPELAVDSRDIDSKSLGMEALSDRRLEAAAKVDKEGLIGLIREKEPVRYDQMLVSDSTIKRYIFVNYGATTYTRTPYVLKFPLYKDLKSEFDRNYLGGSLDHDKVKVVGTSIIDKIKAHGIVPVLDPSYKEGMPFSDVPLAAAGGKVLDEQPVYFIPDETDSCKCNSCNGDKYLPCPKRECRGEHVYDCNECNAQGEVDCDKCHSHGHYTCKTCSGSGELNCPLCDGRKFTNVDGKRKDCNYCNKWGKTRCSNSGNNKDMVGSLFDAATKNFCGGSGQIKCSKCKGKGQTTCKKCAGKGDITCSTCHGDHKDGRYGKVNCGTCETTGEIATFSYFVTEVNRHSKEFMLCNGKEISAPGFGLETIKCHINQKGEAVTSYFSLNGKEIVAYDKYSRDCSEAAESKLGLHKDRYPKLVRETIYYEAVPCVTLDYNHILSNTQHEVSFVGVDKEPQLIFHSNPIAAEEKETISEKYSNWLSKAFNTKKYKDKVDREHEIYLMIHMAKADGRIEDTEKLYISKSITDLHGFTRQEKKRLFDLMAAIEMPPVLPAFSYFSTPDRAEAAKTKLVELVAKADGEFEPEEKLKLQEIEVAIESGNRVRPKGIVQFLKTWQVSLPMIVSCIGLAYGIYWYAFILPVTSAFREHERLLSIESNILERLSESDTFYIYDETLKLSHLSALPLQEGEGVTTYQAFWDKRRGEMQSLYQQVKEGMELEATPVAGISSGKPTSKTVSQNAIPQVKPAIDYGDYLAAFPHQVALFSCPPAGENEHFLYLDVHNIAGELKFTFLGNDYLADETKEELSITSFDPATGKGKALNLKTNEEMSFQIDRTGNGTEIILASKSQTLTFALDDVHSD